MLEVILGILGTAMLAIFGWAFNLASKVQALEESKNSMKELILAKIDAIDEKLDLKFDSTENRLARIERSMNGHLK